MGEPLTVLLEGVIAGEVRGDRAKTEFIYDAGYVAAGGTPLSTSAPINSARHTGIEPWLWGLLPDDSDVIGRWAREFQVSRASVTSLLGTEVGHDCAGAVQFARGADVERLIAREGHVEWLSDADVADRLRLLVADRTAWLGRSNPGQFSLAGAQAKTALRWDGRRWGIPHGAAATTHIVKPAIQGLADQDINEHVCLAAARNAGLLACQTRIARFEDVTAIVATRYDRFDLDGELIRIHQEDMCQALRVSPDDKYESDGGPGAERIVQLLRTVMEPRAAETAVDRFVDALAWNWIIGGTDAHAKNYSLLLDGDQVRLAPLYDIASILPYVDERKSKMAMRIGTEYRLHPWSNPWLKAADRLRLDADRVQARVAALAVAAPHAFAAVAEEFAQGELESTMPEQLVRIVSDRAPRLIARLD